MAASGRGRCRTARMVAPATTLPSRRSSGTAPGALIRARAVRTWCRHCRRSNAAGGARAEAAAAGLQRVDPPGPGQPAGQQAERDRGRRDGDRGRATERPAASVPHGQPGQVTARRPAAGPGVTGPRQRGQPGGHHRQQHSAARYSRRGGQPRNQASGHRIAARQRHRQGENQQHNASSHADHPAQRAERRTQRQEAEVPGDHAEPKGRGADWTAERGSEARAPRARAEVP